MYRTCALLLVVVLAACGDERRAPESALVGEVSAFSLHHPRAEEGLKHDIPLVEIQRGVATPDPRDGIRAFFAPRHRAIEDATWMEDGDRVLVLGERADARAYPLFVLDGHELVNDDVGGKPVLATWCPLCATAVAFERTVAGRVRTFGVSGYLWRSDVLLYDRESESFWSQVEGRAVVGPLTGTRLVRFPSRVMTWAGFRARHPEGRVLSPQDSGGLAPAVYRQSRAYDDYRRGDDLFPGVVAPDRRLPPKEEVLGVVVGGTAHAWTLAHVRAAAQAAGGTGRRSFPAEVGGQTVFVVHEPDGDVAEVLGADGSPLPSLRAFWFAWTLFHPETGLTGSPGPR